MSVEVFEKEMERLISPNAKLVRLASGFQFTEGPVWNEEERALYFSDIPADTIFRYNEGTGTEVFRKPSHYANGLTFDSQGRLVACEHQTRRVTRTSESGREVIADQYRGKRLNSPNDLVIAEDGSVFFTDPLYGLREGLGGPGKQELDFQGLYRVPVGASEPVLLADDFEAPNGLAFSPDEARLYVDDTVQRHVRVFKVGEDYTLTGGEVLVEIKGEGEGKPDGMKVDSKGHIYCTGPQGIWMCTEQGDVIGRVRVPEKTSNLAWGGEGNRTLFITASTSIYQIPFFISGNV
ncbi:MAG: SMP-30/gluconolactonase/LRE family protein [Anaerolineales bacterium]